MRVVRRVLLHRLVRGGLVVLVDRLRLGLVVVVLAGDVAALAVGLVADLAVVRLAAKKLLCAIAAN